MMNAETLFWVAFVVFVILLVLIGCNAVIEWRLAKRRSKIRRDFLEREFKKALVSAAFEKQRKDLHLGDNDNKK
jgi:hypothetical protein